MARPLSETMIKVLHALDYACSSHGAKEAKRAQVVGMFAAMGTQVDRTLAALERRGYAERKTVRMDEGPVCWQPTDQGRELLETIARAAARFSAPAPLVISSRGRLSALAERRAA